MMVQVTAGSMWDQDEEEDDDADAKAVEKYLVKWSDMSYLHVSWETAEDLIELTTSHVKSQVGGGDNRDTRVGYVYYTTCSNAVCGLLPLQKRAPALFEARCCVYVVVVERVVCVLLWWHCRRCYRTNADRTT